jgi:hypothetical protein
MQIDYKKQLIITNCLNKKHLFYQILNFLSQSTHYKVKKLLKFSKYLYGARGFGPRAVKMAFLTTLDIFWTGQCGCRSESDAFGA